MSRLLDLDERQRLASRAGVITIITNIVITIARALAALSSGSTAVLADAMNSGVDILATLVVLGGSRIAAMPADPNHPYGHEKAEPEAAKLVGILVAGSGAAVALGAWHALHAPAPHAVGLIASVVTVASLLAKQALAKYLFGVGRKIDNQALLADADNQRSDVLASTAALVGALGGRFGVPFLDPAMGLLVAGLILRMGLTMYWRSVHSLMDPAPDPATMALMEQTAARVSGVLSVDEIKARLFGSGIYVDCKIGVNESLTVAEGHRIGGRVKQAIMDAVPTVRDVLIHVNPCTPPEPAAMAPPSG